MFITSGKKIVNFSGNYIEYNGGTFSMCAIWKLQCLGIRPIADKKYIGPSVMFFQNSICVCQSAKNMAGLAEI